MTANKVDSKHSYSMIFDDDCYYEKEGGDNVTINGSEERA